MSDDDHYELEIQNGAPFLFLTNINNGYQCSAARYNGTQWITFGNPAFAPSARNVTKVTSGDISVTGAPFIAFSNIYRNNSMSVMSYESGCPDANLSSLNVKINGTSVPIIPEFRQYITNYHTDVQSTTGSVTITAQPRGSATIEIAGTAAPSKSATITLEPGDNIIPVTVISNDDNETQATYYLKIKRPHSAYASLCGFELYNGSNPLSYSPAFNPNSFTYSANVPSGVAAIRIKPRTANNSHITVASSHTPSEYVSTPVELHFGINKIPVSVTAPDGVTQVEYTLTVTRAADPAISLTTLSLSGITLSSGFNAGIFDYSASVGPTIEDVSVTAVGTGVTIAINDNVPSSGTATATVPLKYGENYINVSTSNTNKTLKAIYSIKVIRQPTDNTALNSLSGISISPAFNRNTLDYTANVASSVSTVSITAIAQNSLSSVFINGDSPATPSSPVSIDLNPGINMVEVDLTSDDESESITYLLKVTRALEYKTPEIAFEKTEIKESESISEYKIPVFLSSAPTSNVTINYTVTSGTASGSGVDYTLANGSLLFEPCEAKKEIILSIVDDNLVESDETIQITLSGPSNALLGNAKVITYTIEDNDFPLVTFSSSSSTISENTPSAHTISVSLSANPVKPVEVNVGVTGGTAENGTDFNISNNTITFASGDPLTKNLSVDIIDDNILEGNEKAFFEFQYFGNAKPGDVTRHTMTIVDDESVERVIEFSTASGSGLELVTNPNITVTINPAPTSIQDITVQYSVTGGTATGGGVDYILTSDTLNFNNTTLVNNIPLTIVNDNVGEGDETVIITLSNPTGGAVLGSPNTFTYTISSECTNIRYVRANVGTSGDGCTWNTAYKYLQDALDDARTSGGSVTEIRVADGDGQRYYPHQTFADPDGSELEFPRTVSFELIEGVTLLGGYPADGGTARNSNPETNGVVLSGDIDGDNSLDGNSYSVVKGASTTLDGFTITGGNADGGCQEPNKGGGIFSSGNSLTINNCYIVGNTATDNGCGIYFYGGVLNCNDCIFKNNPETRTWVSGGAIYALSSNTTIANCRFENNLVDDCGGAIHVGIGTLNVEHSVFIGNECGWNGGAISFSNSTGSTISNSTFTKNTSGRQGGVLYCDASTGQHNIVNTVFFGNKAENGGALYYSYTDASNAQVLNCSFSKNHSIAAGGGLYVHPASATASSVVNCIFWYNTTGFISNDIYEDVAGQLDISYCDIEQDGYAPSNSNLSCIPYAEPSSPNDMRIYADPTCCKDNADQNLAPEDDRDGNARPSGYRDRGAFEYIP